MNHDGGWVVYESVSHRAMICKRVHYRCRVQGVGFRYTAQRLAAGFPVAGYVKNLRDGTVELVAEGEPDQVNAFLTAVADRMADYITDATVNDYSCGSYNGFQIRY
jgi:acylphosphatase